MTYTPLNALVKTVYCQLFGYLKFYAFGVPETLSDVCKAARKSVVTDFCIYMV